MGIWRWIFGGPDSTSNMMLDVDMPSLIQPWVNPATGLPMVGGDTFGVDVGGSPYGSNLHDSGSCSDMGSSHSWPD